MNKVSALNTAAFKIVISYIVIASVWIYFSDRLLSYLVTDQVGIYQTYKGLFFVLATSLLLYVLISRTTKRLKMSKERVERLLKKEKGLRKMTEKTSEDLKNAVEEKEILLRELHHRVKNNLAVIAGLIDLQAQEMEVPESRVPLHRTQSRIYTIAGIHQLLYKEKDLKNIQLSQLLRNLSDTIQDIHAPSRLNIEADIDEIYINVNQAVPLALLLNEILSLISKDASDNQSREITFGTDGRELPKLQIMMNINPVSEGHPERLISGGTSFESNLVSLLQQQLGAEIGSSLNDHQMDIHLSFTLEDKRGSSSNL